MNYKLIEMQVFSDKRGKLVSLESLKNVPFEIKRLYYIYDTLSNEERGKHAHKKLEQIVIALAGSCEFVLDNGYIKENVILNRPDLGLYIGKNMWREMKNFSQDCRLIILANDYYDESEYIRNYDDFLQYISH